VDNISRKYHYKREDTIGVYKSTLENYEEQLRKFNREHQHPDEEVRFALRGKGYFEVRSKNDQWIRIEVIPGDFLILPPGIYHRFFLHEEEQGIVFLRLFQDDAPYTITFRRTVDDTIINR
jgi:1,2-dihydroxy-3-keto-5-methylthiopentene dioxygenase